MNRSIKFRVWSGSMWLDGNDANIHPQNSDSTEIELVASYPHSKHILCQFTGLLDKSGKEIYEGDILQSGEGEGSSFKYEVRWQDSRPFFMLYNIDQKFKGHEYEKWAIWGKDHPYSIIGNIYENPELLTNK